MIVTQENISDVIRKLESLQLLACDTETTGLEEVDIPFAVIFADRDDTYYFDIRSTPDMWGRFTNLLSDPSRTLVFQNAKFDMRMLSAATNMGVGCKVADIACAARLLRNDHIGMKAYSLDAQAKRILGKAKDDRVEKYIKEHKLHETRTDYFGKTYEVPRYDRVPFELMSQYAQTDARLTYDLYAAYITQLDPDSYRLFLNECALTKVCFNMERIGVVLNEQYTIQAMYHEKQLLKDERERFYLLTKAEYVNSAKSIQKLIQYQLPLTPLRPSPFGTGTTGGNPSLTDDIVEKILASDAAEYDKLVVRYVQTIRYYEKRIGTYYESYLNKRDRTGLIHPVMWLAGTRTGRFSYSDPNLQNIPKEEKSNDPFVIRGCFQPRAGRVFVSMDYSQMEYRMMADYAGQLDVILAVMNGADFHQAIADLLNIPRSDAKTVNFAILYGAGTEKIAEMLGMSFREAQRLKDKYYMALPKVESFIDSVIATGRSRGYVINWAGRRLYADKEFAYALPNHLIQGGGADVVKIAMVRIAEEFPGLIMNWQIHDQLVFEMLPEEYQYIPRIKEIMESVYKPRNGMKLEVDIEWSPVSLAKRDLIKGLPHAS